MTCYLSTIRELNGGYCRKLALSTHLRRLTLSKTDCKNSRILLFFCENKIYDFWSPALKFDRVHSRAVSAGA